MDFYLLICRLIYRYVLPVAFAIVLTLTAFGWLSFMNSYEARRADLQGIPHTQQIPEVSSIFRPASASPHQGRTTPHAEPTARESSHHASRIAARIDRAKAELRRRGLKIARKMRIAGHRIKAAFD